MSKKSLDQVNDNCDHVYVLGDTVASVVIEAPSPYSEEKKRCIDSRTELRTSYIDLQKRNRKKYYEVGWWTGLASGVSAVIIGSVLGAVSKAKK